MKFINFGNCLISVENILSIRIKHKDSFKESLWNLEIFLKNISGGNGDSYYFESFTTEEGAKERLEDIIKKIGIEVI